MVFRRPIFGWPEENPVVIHRLLEATWLNPTAVPPALVLATLYQYAMEKGYFPL
jgi:hypothetical protein